MRLSRYVLLALVVMAIATVASLAVAGGERGGTRGGYVPVEIGVAEGVVGAGNTVTYRVTMDDVSARGQTLLISSSNGTAYSSIPVFVWVEPGTDHVDFEATISMNPPASWT